MLCARTSVFAWLLWVLLLFNALWHCVIVACEWAYLLSPGLPAVTTLLQQDPQGHAMVLRLVCVCVCVCVCLYVCEGCGAQGT